MSVKFDLNRVMIGSSPVPSLGGVGGSSSFATDSSDDRYAAVVQAPYDITISHLLLAYNVRSGTPPTYKIGLQSIATDGTPSGTYLGGGSPASVAFTPASDNSWNNTTRWLQLDNARTVSAGEFFAIVVEYSSGTINISNRSTFLSDIGSYFNAVGFPVSMTQINGAAWVKNGARSPLYGIRNSDYSKVAGWPFLTSDGVVVNVTGDRAALKFSLPEIWPSAVVMGIRFTGSWSAGGQVKVAIWDGTTAVASVTFDTDIHSSTNPIILHEVYFDSNVTLDTGHTYYAGLECIGNLGVTLNRTLFQANDDMEALPGGKTWVYSGYSGGVWTDTDTARPYIDFILDDIDFSSTNPPDGSIATGGLLSLGSAASTALILTPISSGNLERIAFDPAPYWGPSGDLPTLNTQTLDSSDDRIAWIIQLNEDITIAKLGFNYVSRTGVPPNYKISIQSPDSLGNPDGFVLQSGNAVGVFTPPTDTSWDNTFQWIEIDEPYFGSRGDWVFIVIEYDSGTVDAGNCSTFLRGFDGYNARIVGSQVVRSQIDGGSWDQASFMSVTAVMGVKDATGDLVMGFPVQSFYTTKATGVTSFPTNGNGILRQALKFTFYDFAAPDTVAAFQCIGGHFVLNDMPPDGTIRFGIFPVVEKDVFTNWFASTDGLQHVTMYLDTKVPGTADYMNFIIPLDDGWRMGIERVDVDIGILGVQVSEAEDLRAFNGGEETLFDSPNLGIWCMSEYREDNQWHDLNTVRPFVQPILINLSSTNI